MEGKQLIIMKSNKDETRKTSEAVHTHTHTHTHGYLLKGRKKFQKIIKIIAFLFILFICIGKINDIVKRKESDKKVIDFFKQQENFDVLILGSSHAMNGVFPMQLWEEFGIVSYNLGQHTNFITNSYYNMLLSLQYTNPKLIVIDTFCNDETTRRLEGTREMLDMYPASYTKFITIKKLFNGKDLIRNEMEYLFHFSMYHNRWNQLNKDDFCKVGSYEKGAESRINVKSVKEGNDYISKVQTNEYAYLKEIIEHCTENEIELLVTYLPYPALDKDKSFSNDIKTICEQCDVNYINFLDKEIINFDTDLYDENHLNPSGARKITDYLGKYIMENYDIQDQRQNKSYSFWNEDYNEYIDLKINNLKKNAKNLNNYLMLLYDEEDIKYEIKISSKRKIEENSTLKSLLENIDNNYEIDDTVFEEKQDKTIKITTWDNRTGKEIATVWF